MGAPYAHSEGRRADPIRGARMRRPRQALAISLACALAFVSPGSARGTTDDSASVESPAASEVPAASAQSRAVPRASDFSVTFDSEWIRLSIVGDSVEVRGRYFLLCRNGTGEQISLFYPFPEDSLMEGARMVSLQGWVGGRNVGAMTWTDSRGAPGVRWVTPPCTADSIAIEAVYRQKLTSTYARYIVTTTQDWRRPLRFARFEIRLPAEAAPVEFSFPFEEREDSEGRYYGFETTDFLPDRDVIVRWKILGPSNGVRRLGTGG